MKFEPSSFRLLNEVLGYEPLGQGGSSVNRLDPEETPGLRVFRFQLSGLSSPVVEDLVLSEQDPQEDPELTELLSGLGTSKRRQVIVIPGGLQATTETSKRGRASITLDQLFSRLADVPHELPRLIQEKGRRDFNHAHFRHRFQERYVEVLHSPVPGWERKQSSKATEYLLDWARTSTRRHPIILLGERGSGKTWQFFRFCQAVFALHRKEPWSYGPAFYLELRDESLYSNPFGVSAGLFSDAILRNYRGVRYVFDARLLEAFLAAGHTPLCLDGFEEIPQVIHGDETIAQSTLRRICAGLPLGSRYLIACRAAQFGTLDRMLNLRVWANTTIGDSFEVLQLKPFNEESVRKYIVAAGQGDTDSILWSMVTHGEAVSKQHGWSPDESVKEAVRICSFYPALLAAMVERKSTGSDRPLSGLDFLHAALVEGIITHNINMGKTTDRYRHPRKGPLLLDTQARLEILGELTWHLAARGKEVVDMGSLPPRIKLLYGLDLEEVQKDLRTHTLLEILPVPEKDLGGEETAAVLSLAEERLRLSVRPVATDDSSYFPQLASTEESITSSFSKFSQPQKSTRGKELTTVALQAAPIGVTSVSGAFLLARHISRRLRLLSFLPEAPDSDGSIAALDRWRPLGGLPLAPPAAALLREMLQRKKAARGFWASTNPRDIVKAAVRVVATAAGKPDFSVFSPCLRYLGHNLEAMGLVSAGQREEFDPWFSDSVARIVRPPKGLPGYGMVLVPPASSSAAPEVLCNKGLSDPPPGMNQPLLMGVREVTNEDFRRFLQSGEGAEWKVDRITLAGSFRRRSQSRFANYANEYYLYFWQRDQKSGQHEPDSNALDHPVVYVSWHSCAAFCNWLTGTESGTKVYSHLPSEESAGRQANDQPDGRKLPGYRLPSAAEWSWAARGFRLDVEYPWELYPLVLPKKTAPSWLTDRSEKSSDSDEEQAREWLRQGRAAYEEVLTTSSKEHLPVLSDPLGSMGISGMMGNVKEWCHDTVGHGKLEERAILGATSLLEKESYHYSYGTSLFPQNTNPDVGFRICRPLSGEEVEILQQQAQRISKCAPAAT